MPLSALNTLPSFLIWESLAQNITGKRAFTRALEDSGVSILKRLYPVHFACISSRFFPAVTISCFDRQWFV